jgi:hypothetical protein
MSSNPAPESKPGNVSLADEEAIALMRQRHAKWLQDKTA